MEAFQLSIRDFPSGHKPCTAAKSQSSKQGVDEVNLVGML